MIPGHGAGTVKRTPCLLGKREKKHLSSASGNLSRGMYAGRSNG